MKIRKKGARASKKKKKENQTHKLSSITQIIFTNQSNHQCSPQRQTVIGTYYLQTEIVSY